MRLPFGAHVFERDQLVSPLGKRLNEAFVFDPSINGVFSFGSDFRLAAFFQPGKDEAASETEIVQAGLFQATSTEFTFFPMQADLYVAADLGEHVTLYTDLGAHGSFEAFALLHSLAGGFYVKAGLFNAPFGLKYPNHTASTRAPIGFDPRSKDAGIEVGLVLPWIEAHAALQNGESGGSPIDTVPGVSVAGRVAFIINGDAINLSAGGSYQRIGGHERPPEGGGELDRVEQRSGVFLTAAAGRFAYLGEAAIRQSLGDRPDTMAKGQFVSYQELDFLLMRGLELTASYEFMDRDIGRKLIPGGDVHRFGVAFEYFPIPFVEINVIFRQYLSAKGGSEDGQKEILAFLHLFF